MMMIDIWRQNWEPQNFQIHESMVCKLNHFNNRRHEIVQHGWSFENIVKYQKTIFYHQCYKENPNIINKR